MGRQGVAMKLFPTPPNYNSCPCPPSEHKTGIMSPFSAYPHVESRPTVKMIKRGPQSLPHALPAVLPFGNDIICSSSDPDSSFAALYPVVTWISMGSYL